MYVHGSCVAQQQLIVGNLRYVASH